MSLPVPLAVRVGDQHITGEVQSLAFRREAVGGVRSITFNLARSLTDLSGLDPLAKVYIYDTRTAATVAEARFADPGRGADSNGQRWDCVAFGPAQHASDITRPYIVIDKDLSRWRTTDVVHSETSVSVSSKPGDATGVNPSQGLLESFSPDINVNTNSRAVGTYEDLWSAGQTIGAIQFNWVTSLTLGNWTVEAIVRTDGAGATAAFATTWDTAGGTVNVVPPTNYAIGHNIVDLRIKYNGGAAVTSGETWGWFSNVVVRSHLKNADGTNWAASDLLFSYCLPGNIINDLLGRGFLPEFDATTASVAGGTYQITQLAYRDGVTPGQVLDDLMKWEPAYRWYTYPSGASGKYGFAWALWPTTVRYEATLDDGGSFPLSTQSLYNEVWVRWVDSSGRTRWERRTKACRILDAKGLVRIGSIDLGSEAGSVSQAQQAGDSFLAERNVPKNAGTLTVARPIRDVIRGCDVQPWEIEAGELVRVRGVEAYPDAFNTSTNDGVGVFRIFAVDYTSEGNSASLSLDSDPHTTEDALVALMNDRKRGLPSKPGSGW